MTNRDFNRVVKGMAEQDDIRKVDRKHLARLINWMDKEHSESNSDEEKSPESENKPEKRESKGNAGETDSPSDSK